MNPFEGVSEPFAHSCKLFEKKGYIFSHSMNPFGQVNELFAACLEAMRFTSLSGSC